MSSWINLLPLPLLGVQALYTVVSSCQHQFSYFYLSALYASHNLKKTTKRLQKDLDTHHNYQLY
jgi:hypothetical protein